MTSHVRTPVTEVFAVCTKQFPSALRLARTGSIKVLLTQQPDGLWTLPSGFAIGRESQISVLARTLSNEARGLRILGISELIMRKDLEGPEALTSDIAAYAIHCFGEIVPESALGDPEVAWIGSIDREITKASREILTLALNQGRLRPAV